jgi:predicted DCC family thiol-disulfide oxidoreductase YuxK
MSDKIYYDESCYVCSLEINAVRKRGEACGIEFVDISAPEFNVSGDFETEMIGEFEGERTVGAETFRKMYEQIGFKRAVAFSRLPAVKQIFNFGYYVFAHWVRPNLPKKRTRKND